MKIEIYTSSAQEFKNRIFKDVRDGKLRTWALRSTTDGYVLTHSPDQWVDRVLLEFKVYQNSLVITPVYWSGQTAPTRDDNGYVLGRFCEPLFVHYGDIVKGFKTVA